MNIKPMLASDAVESKLRFPLYMQPKIDGVRALNFDGTLRGRSLKKHANKHVTELYSVPACMGFDGEMTAERDTHPRLCSLTSSALSTIKGVPATQWWLFDFVTSSTIGLKYHERMNALYHQLHRITTEPHFKGPHVVGLKMVPSVLCTNLTDFLAQDDQWLAMGYEGSIVRDPNGLYKEGRSTVAEGGLLRIKRFAEDEAVVTAIVEGQTNTNTATLNELGFTHRSSDMGGMVPNGMVGSLTCVDVKTGDGITVAAGCMTHEERVNWFQHPEQLIGKTVKYKHFPRGVKDKPRFPTFQSVRIQSDIGAHST